MPLRFAADPDSPFVICWHVLNDDTIVGTVYYDDGDTSDGGPPRPSGWAAFVNGSNQHMGLPVADHTDVADEAVRYALNYLRHRDALNPPDRTPEQALAALPWKAPNAQEPQRLSGSRLRPVDARVAQSWLDTQPD